MEEERPKPRPKPVYDPGSDADLQPELALIDTINRLQARVNTNVGHLIIQILPRDRKMALFLTANEDEAEYIIKATATPAQRFKANQQAFKIAQAQLQELLVHQLEWQPQADHLNDVLAQLHNPDVAPVITAAETDIVENALILAAIQIQWPEQPASSQNSPKYANDIPSMTADIEHIVEQAQAEGIQQAETPSHPEPDTRAALASVAIETANLDDVLAALRERDIPLTVTEVETAIGGLRAITRLGNKTAWQLGLHAVERGLITQTKLAELLGVNKGTVSRRYRESTNENKDQDGSD